MHRHAVEAWRSCRASVSFVRVVCCCCRKFVAVVFSVARIFQKIIPRRTRGIGLKRSTMAQERVLLTQGSHAMAHHVPKNLSRRNIVRTVRKKLYPRRPQSRSGSSQGVACPSLTVAIPVGFRVDFEDAERRRAGAGAVLLLGGFMTAPLRPEDWSAR